MNQSGAVPIRKLIVIPAVITLAVTLLRLIGELLEWSTRLFNAAAGGGGALVGIVWLVPVFGIVFGVQLVGLGRGPENLGRAFGFPVLGLLIVIATFAGAQRLGVPFVGQILLGAVASLAAVLVALRGWPALAQTLLAYGLAARVPVALVMLAAILGGWGTHYDAPAPGQPEMSPLLEWVMIGLIPQLTVWVVFTIVVGALFGTVAAVVARRLSSRG